MIDSRSSGKAAERRVAKDMKGQRIGIMGMDDVRVPPKDGLGISFEVKTRKKLPTSIKKWFKQAELNVHKRNIPVLVMKEKETKWGEAFIMLKYEHFLKYMISFYARREK
jgi:uracil DNA glycosylase